jgi:hypothetical protein
LSYLNEVRFRDEMSRNMKNMSYGDEIVALKDEAETPIPTAWREPLRDIVAAFVAGDYGLEKGVANVAPVSAEAALRIRNCLHGYGATLIALPDTTWSSSVCIWYGDHWDALVDLWTQEEGQSDLVLHVRVSEANPGFTIQIHLVYVP